jgi:hypothetical protein
MSQVVEHLPRKHKAPSSNPHTTPPPKKDFHEAKGDTYFGIKNSKPPPHYEF